MPSKLSGAHGRRVRLRLPQDSGLEEVENARVELERLNAKWAEAEQRQQALRSGAREDARQADLAAAGHAVRAGKKPPTSRQVDAVDREIEELSTRLAALDSALDMVEDELISAIDQKREQRVGELAAQLAEEQAAWREQIRALEAQLEKINTTASLGRWYRHFPGKHPAFRLGSFGHLNLRDGTGSPAAALEALHAAFEVQEVPDRHVMPIPPDGPQPLVRRVA